MLQNVASKRSGILNAPSAGMIISPELIPHTEFHTGIWLRSVENAGWYYFMKKNNVNKITSENFIKSVDEPLKELVNFLHRRNIRTTPSCSGHHISERNLSALYSLLEKDCVQIQTNGLMLKDVETGRARFYKNKNYSLPWNRRDFIEKLESYQGKGVLGLRLGNRKKAVKKTLDLKLNGVRTDFRDSITFIFTDGNSHDSIPATWKKITAKIKSAIEYDS